MTAIQLIAGLSNPIPDYGKTRHNAGAWFIEQLLQSQSAPLAASNKFFGSYHKLTLANRPCHLLIPSLFMNENGRSVAQCLHFYKLPPEALLIAHDDLDLPVGTIRLKWQGGDGGHNGLKDVIRHLQTPDFYRLRIGIGHPGTRSDVVNYVLGIPPRSEREHIDEALTRALAIVPHLMSGAMQKAMQQLHT